MTAIITAIRRIGAISSTGTSIRHRRRPRHPIMARISAHMVPIMARGPGIRVPIGTDKSIKNIQTPEPR